MNKPTRKRTFPNLDLIRERSLHSQPATKTISIIKVTKAWVEKNTKAEAKRRANIEAVAKRCLNINSSIQLY
jgi:hypothetical protein